MVCGFVDTGLMGQERDIDARKGKGARLETVGAEIEWRKGGRWISSG